MMEIETENVSETDGENHEGLPRRKPIRLEGYDYSKSGMYFVTICVHDRLHLFGKITTSVGSVGEGLCAFPCAFPTTTPKMELNDAGQMINKWWNELCKKYGNIKLHEYTIMPNHFHGIIQIVDLIKTAGTAKTGNSVKQIPGEHIPIQGEHIGSPLHTMMGWFKTMTTNEYIRMVKSNGWAPFSGKLWQRNYYEHIIRDEQSRLKIARYIDNNPLNWEINKEFTGKTI